MTNQQVLFDSHLQTSILMIFSKSEKILDNIYMYIYKYIWWCEDELNWKTALFWYDP